jgi:hypothetical protein
MVREILSVLEPAIGIFPQKQLENAEICQLIPEFQDFCWEGVGENVECET